MSKIYQYRKRTKGADWQNCTVDAYEGFKRGTNMQRLFEVREVEDDAKPTPNAVVEPKKSTRKKKTEQ